MRFEVTQQLRGSCEAAIAVFASPELYEHLQGLPKIGEPKVLDRAERDGKITMRVHYRFVADLPSAATAVIDPRKLTWVDETVYDVVGLRSTTRLLPDHYPDRLTANASATFRPTGTAGDACARRISGELKVRMPLVGGKVENAIVMGLREHLADEARIVNDLLATPG